MRYIGYPTADKIKAYIQPQRESLAIMSSSNEKEGAWDFVKSVITKQDGDVSKITSVDLPSGKKQFEEYIKYFSAAEPYTRDDGTVIKPFDKGVTVNELECVINPYSEEEVEAIRELIKNAAIKTDNTTLRIIMEPELGNYFDGIKTLDETINILQDRVGKFVNENK